MTPGREGGTIVVPRQRPSGWRPAWDAKAPSTRVSRVLDAGDWLAATGRALIDVQAAADPSLTVAISAVGATLVRLTVSGGAPGLLPVRLRLLLSEGDEDEILAIQPVRATGAPDGLVAAEAQPPDHIPAVM